MKKTVLLFFAVLCFLLGGCAKEYINDNVAFLNSNGLSSVAGIIVRASNEETTARSTVRSAGEEPVVFTGNDILWFNETTKELRFKDNFAMKDVFGGYKSIKFYMDGEYLFSSMIFVSSVSSQVFNSLVFYYNIMENKYYLNDGYPVINDDITIISIVNGDAVRANEMYQQLRDENMQKIESEWNKFINQLKQGGQLYKF
jgi:hypothetical protein